MQKLCNGPLHGENGAWLPLRTFWTHKRGARAGKPMSQCIACERVKRGRDPNSGLIEVDRVYFIFRELQYRLGKAETCRRLGISENLWYRLDNRIYKKMYRETARKAILLLKELRENRVVRHRASIRHGSLARGHREKTVGIGDHADKFYNGTDDHEAEYRRERRRKEKGSVV
jgi:hypothetical protein